MRRQKTAYAIAKRTFDLTASAIGALLLSPFLATVALWVKTDSSGPVFFRQERVGREERVFRIYKFRTMAHAPAEKGMEITPSGDSRITRSGRFLRKYKIDELPQLFNVLLGDMSLVGPRPEVPYYVAMYPQEAKEVIFSVRPGITDWASLQFKDEGEILSHSSNPQETYVQEILPVKVDLACRYVRRASFGEDLKILWGTVQGVFFEK